MSCCDENRLMPVGEARQRLFDYFKESPDIVHVHLLNAAGLTLAEPVVSEIDVPPHDNSAMDGYAFNSKDLNSKDSAGEVAEALSLPVSQRIPAGFAPAPLERNTIARIFTGAPVPEGADTVIMQEDCSEADGVVSFPASFKAGAHIRKRGEDIRAGSEILAAGRRLSPQDIGLAASVGVGQLSVYKPLKIALLCSGDELLEPGQPPEPGKIYNSNRYLLEPLLKQQGFDVLDMGTVEDTLEATLAALEQAANEADVVITTGGVSVGEEDYIKAAVEELGGMSLWKVAIKPGKPFAFGHIQQTPFIGLPGNPVSVFATFLLLGLPYLQQLQGSTWSHWPTTSMAAAFDVKKAGKRDEFVRVKRVVSGDSTVLKKYPNQSSGVLSSAAWCDGFALIPAGKTLEIGEKVDFIALSDLMG